MMRAVTLALGIVMIAIGAYLALHPLWAHGRPVTQSLLWDLAFAALFLLRGTMNVRRVRRPTMKAPT